MDAKIYEKTVQSVDVIDMRIKPLIKGLKLKEDQGSIPNGCVMSKNGSGEGIPYQNYAAIDLVGLTNGTNKAYTYAGAGFDGELAPRSIVVAHGDQELKDDGHGKLYGDGSGTINYLTGAIAATFTDAPADESDAPTVVAASLPVAVSVREADTALNDDAEPLMDVVSCVYFGSVKRDVANVNGVALTQADVDLLEKSNIYAVY